MVEADVVLEAASANGIEETKGAKPVDVAGVFGHFERDLDVRLCAEVVYFGGLDLGDDVDKVGAVTQVAVVQLEFVRAYDAVFLARVKRR